MNQRLPQVNNNFYSSPYQSMMSPGFTHPGPGYKGIGTLGEQLHGYNGFVPSGNHPASDAGRHPGLDRQHPVGLAAVLVDAEQRQRRRRLSRSRRLRPLPVRRVPVLRRSEAGRQRRRSSTNNVRNFSAKVTSASSWQAKTCAHAPDVVRQRLHEPGRRQHELNSTQLPPGGQTVGQGAVQGGGNQPSRASKTLGLFVQEQAGASRPHVPHGRGAHRSEQRVRHELPARLLSEGEPVVDPVGRVVLPEVSTG